MKLGPLYIGSAIAGALIAFLVLGYMQKRKAAA
jgi:hypothetical protein